jgi:hypothetical protein
MRALRVMLMCPWSVLCVLGHPHRAGLADYVQAKRKASADGAAFSKERPGSSLWRSRLRPAILRFFNLDAIEGQDRIPRSSKPPKEGDELKCTTRSKSEARNRQIEKIPIFLQRQGSGARPCLEGALIHQRHRTFVQSEQTVGQLEPGCPRRA